MTQPGLPAERTSLARPLILGFLALGSLAAAGVFALRLFHQPRPDIASLPTAPAATPVPPPSARSVPSPAAGPIPPTFDIVRIVPGGGAVIAGHAAPGAEIAIMADGKELGRVEADASGSWVFVPSAQLPTGGREFTLSERLPDTGEIIIVLQGVLNIRGRNVERHHPIRFQPDAHREGARPKNLGVLNAADRRKLGLNHPG